MMPEVDLMAWDSIANNSHYIAKVLNDWNGLNSRQN